MPGLFSNRGGYRYKWKGLGTTHFYSLGCVFRRQGYRGSELHGLTINPLLVIRGTSAPAVALDTALWRAHPRPADVYSRLHGQPRKKTKNLDFQNPHYGEGLTSMSRLVCATGFPEAK